MYVAGVAVFTLGAAGAALSASLAMMIAWRFVQGLGASLLIPQTVAVVNQVFPPERRGRAYGAWGVVGSAAAITGPLLGGVVVSALGWRGVFLVHIPVGIVAVILGLRWVPNLPVSAVPIDPLGVVLSLLGLGSIVLAAQEGPRHPWLWILAPVGLAALVFFALRQRRSDALVPLRLFAVRNYNVGMVTISAMGMFSAAGLIPLMAWLQDARGLDSASAGALATPMAITALLLGPTGGFLAERVSPAIMHGVGFTLLSVCFWAEAWIFQARASLWIVATVLVVIGVGQSCIWASNAAAALGEIPGEDMGAASGAYNAARQVGAVVGVASVGAVMTAFGTVGAVLLLAVVLAGAALLSLRFQRGHGPAQHAD
ncbi:DHA2 family efflux MFS transporter permease subunit [Corynebacterium tapiri]